MSDQEKPYTNPSKESTQGRVEEPYISWDLSKAAQIINSGLLTEVLQTIQERLSISNLELATLLMISPRTLDRRKKEDLLPADESERSYRIARLTDLAAEVLGSMDDASAWFKRPNYALGNQKPIDMMKTEPGARLVERTLHQIEHGMPV